MERKPGGKIASLLLSAILAVGLVPAIPVAASAQDALAGSAADASSDVATQASLPAGASTVGGVLP